MSYGQCGNYFTKRCLERQEYLRPLVMLQVQRRANKLNTFLKLRTESSTELARDLATKPFLFRTDHNNNNGETEN